MNERLAEESDDQASDQSGSPGTGPSTGVGGRSEDSTSSVSPQEAAERINPGDSGFADPTPPDEE
jgi:hypothetical protein